MSNVKYHLILRTVAYAVFPEISRSLFISGDINSGCQHASTYSTGKLQRLNRVHPREDSHFRRERSFFPTTVATATTTVSERRREDGRPPRRRQPQESAVGRSVADTIACEGATDGRTEEPTVRPSALSFPASTGYKQRGDRWPKRTDERAYAYAYARRVFPRANYPYRARQCTLRASLNRVKNTL